MLAPRTLASLCLALLILGMGIVLPGGSSTPARAQALNSFEQQLLDLSAALGALHHLRGHCRRNEATVWREAMKELIDREKPSRRQASAMTRHFNDAYYAAQDRFPRCTVDTEREARLKAVNAAVITESLIAEMN